MYQSERQKYEMLGRVRDFGRTYGHLFPESSLARQAFTVVANAVAEIEKRGEAAYPLLKDPAGPFRAKNAYMIVVTSSGIEKVNPAFPEYVGKNVLNVKDTQGKLIIREMLEVAKNNNTGWVDYMWPKPGEKTASKKSTYINKAKLGNDWVAVGCGVYL